MKTSRIHYLTTAAHMGLKNIISHSRAQQTLSMDHINISSQTLTISCNYLRCHVITVRFHGRNSDIKQIYPLRFVSIG